MKTAIVFYSMNGNVRSVDTNELRKILKEKGAKVD